MDVDEAGGKTVATIVSQVADKLAAALKGGKKGGGKGKEGKDGKGNQQTCTKCGEKDHKTEDCRYFDGECSNCRKRAPC